MVLSSGTRLGPHEVLSLLGSGGMGEVYRARDTRLGRDVAIKALPAEVAQDPERLARFRREAHLLASLNHPHIAAVYGLEELDGKLLLVLELIEGEDLADRLKRGAIPLDEALGIAKQIAEALEEAHEKGIVHRDLKPANIKLTPEGKVKVLDFGLAKAYAADADADKADVSRSPTLTRAGTEAGVILGTAAYMSPEQARGKAVDKRGDIWAFGVVLFEMLTGTRLFRGETVSDTLAAVLKADTDWTLLPAETPTRIRALLRRCLARDPRERLRDIGDARLEIEEIRSTSHAADGIPTATPESGAWRRALPWLFTAVMGAALGALWASEIRRSQVVTSRPAHLQVVLPPGLTVAVDTDHPALALSPDGSRLVFVADDHGTRRLYQRDLADPSFRAIDGTEGASDPFFSPDGAWIGFFDGTTLKKVPSSGGVPVGVHAVTSTGVNRGATWSANDTVIYAASVNSGLQRGSLAGERKHPFADWVSITNPAEPYAWPEALPNGRDVLFTDNTAKHSDEARVAVLSLQTSQIKTLVTGGTNARYAATGHALFARGSSIYAVPFDAGRVEVTGPERKLLDGVMTHFTGAAQFAVAADGTLAYIAGPVEPREDELLWVNRQGATEALLDSGRMLLDPRLSPDGARLALASPEGANLDIWLLDIARHTLTRLTSHRGEDFHPVWSPDGKRLAFGSEIGEDNGEQGPRLAWFIPGSNEPPEQLLHTPSAEGNWDIPSSWSPDGRYVAFTADRDGAPSQISLLPTSGPREPIAFSHTSARETAAMFSPDGKRIAYVSDDSGREEVYVRPFPGPGERIQISTDGGAEPLWARDGHEIFYREGNKMMVVRVTTGASLGAGAPKALFEGRFQKTQGGASVANYDVSPDGRRFVMVRRKNLVTPTVIDVVFDWPQVFHVRGPSAR